MRKYNRLYIWVEGPDDKEFFDKVIKPRFERKYGRGKVHIRQYSEMKNEEVISLIKGLKARGHDCIGVADINKAPCVSERKREKQGEEFRDIDEDKIVIVVRKIESWYLAGLDSDACKKLGITELKNTDKVAKGKFDSLWRRNKRFNFRLDFRSELLKFFDIETAKKKNKSFRYFVEKYGLQSIDGSST
jgi:hypothetical protein